MHIVNSPIAHLILSNIVSEVLTIDLLRSVLAIAIAVELMTISKK